MDWFRTLIFILIILFNSSIYCSEHIKIQIISQKNTVSSVKIKSLQDYILSVKPFDRYKDRIRFEVVIVDELDQLDLYSLDDGLVTVSKNLSRNYEQYLDPKALLVIVIELRHLNRGFSFKIDNWRIAVYPINLKPGVLMHEIGHALFDLGDEYQSVLAVRFSEYELAKYKNLTGKIPVPLWEEIKTQTGDTAMGYYMGGLDSSENVYRAYPDCIMRSSEGDFCPVCSYYIEKFFNDIKSK